MASAVSSSAQGVVASEPPPMEVPPWLKSLPLAPEFHPTLQEFQDPIAYILKIEKEAADYGICKIVPPLPSAPKKTAVANFNRSFAARDPGGGKPPTFTTRQQQIGFCPRRPRPVQKPVWQSGERYTLQQFEAKARQFERSYLRRTAGGGGRKAATAPALSPLEMETLFWRASADKPFSVEYANDMPGSGFAPLAAAAGRRCREEVPANLGESAWNMRGVSRAKGSLLRFMKEEIPGVTSPMVYVAMLFSWFAWHVEDHELHSLNYLHMGAGKTWYGVPRDAGLAFEEVVGVHGYGGDGNPLSKSSANISEIMSVTFAILGEKTTVMSPEVFVGAGIPCCRLVQNAGDFVVTFPGSYHLGFSHGFNCGEAANIATPEWLKFAKEAAVRRASIDCPPLVSHFQLLYALALSLCTRMPMCEGSEPRSSRLKDKIKGEGEEMVKNAFVQSVIQNNHLLSVLLDSGNSCVVLPQNAPESPLCSTSLVRSQVKVKPRKSLGICSHQEALEASQLLHSSDDDSGWNARIRDFNGLFSFKGNFTSTGNDKTVSLGTDNKFVNADHYSTSSDSQNLEGEKEGTTICDGLLEQGLLSCVTCGILSFACVAVVQPRETTAKYFMSADCSFLDDHVFGSGEASGISRDTNQRTNNNSLVADIVQVSDQSVEMISDVTCPSGASALDLLASIYEDSSDVEDEDVPHEKSRCSDKNDPEKDSSSCNANQPFVTAVEPQIIYSREVEHDKTYWHLADADNQTDMSIQSSQSADISDNLNGHISAAADDICQIESGFCSPDQPENWKLVSASYLEDNRTVANSGTSTKFVGEPRGAQCRELDGQNAEDHYSSLKMGNLTSVFKDLPVNRDICGNRIVPVKTALLHPELRNVDIKLMSSTALVMQGSDKDSSRLHVFCLEHAAEIEKQLQPIGGVHMMVLCHPDYPKIESEAKLLAKEQGIGYIWKNVKFREANEEDQERIRAAIEDEQVMPMNSDWTVKLGINLCYTANLSKSPLYSKQMPYNPVIYKAFGRDSTGNSPMKPKATRRCPGRQKKIVAAGRWCGKVWMSNQVHPYLAHKKETQEQEQTEGLYSFDTDQNPLIEIDIGHSSGLSSKRNSSGSNLAANNSGKKRKRPSKMANSKKPQHSSTMADRNSKTDDVSAIPASPLGRTLRSSHLRHNDSSSQGKSSLKNESGGPGTHLKKRSSKSEELKNKLASKKQSTKRKAKNTQTASLAVKGKEEEYTCDIEGCSMSFSTKQDLALHKRDICPVKGCGKKFFSHKYLVQHRKVHMDDRPLVCPWKGCKMTFKWPWARTEHIRVHTGDRPYVCWESGCGQTFRFVSDFSRHKRKTGHSAKKGRRRPGL
ncbi:lysine-specific demethylase REF6-like isoform X2 [Musa acuminata AAA Group]|uniref:lysine-specific demethylase REF6-like isoform X2 n=1 Tax=Musa acuminata AAA Group TaxID=214697 RepID=UPI0031E3A071